MRIATSLLGLLLICASAAAEPATETLRFAIIRNGDQIGTHTIELKRSGQEIAVNIETEVLVKVLFVTAYRFQHAASERWVNGRLVALDSSTDDNGTLHKVAVALKASALDVQADGTAPTGGSISYAGGYSSTGSVAISVDAGTDGESGLAPGGATIERSTAPLEDGGCGR